MDEITRLAREAAREEAQAGLLHQRNQHQQERQQFEQRHQNDMVGVAREIRELNDRLQAYQRAVMINGLPLGPPDLTTRS